MCRVGVFCGLVIEDTCDILSVQRCVWCVDLNHAGRTSSQHVHNSRPVLNAPLACVMLRLLTNVSEFGMEMVGLTGRIISARGNAYDDSSANSSDL